MRGLSAWQSHFGLEDQAGEPSNILTGFFKTIGGLGPGLTLFGEWTGGGWTQLCFGM